MLNIPTPPPARHAGMLGSPVQRGDTVGAHMGSATDEVERLMTLFFWKLLGEDEALTALRAQMPEIPEELWQRQLQQLAARRPSPAPVPTAPSLAA